MTSTGIVLILIGLFVIINSKNLVGVLQGNLKINNQLSKTSSDQTSTQTQNRPASSGSGR